jgi:hypothetical protein
VIAGAAKRGLERPLLGNDARAQPLGLSFHPIEYTLHAGLLPRGERELAVAGGIQDVARAGIPVELGRARQTHSPSLG